MGSCESATGSDRSSSDRASGGQEAADRSREAAEASRRAEAVRSAQERARTATETAIKTATQGSFKAGQDQLAAAAFEAKQAQDMKVRDALSRQAAAQTAATQAQAANMTASQVSAATSTAAAVATGALQTATATRTAVCVATQTPSSTYDLAKLAQQTVQAQSTGQLAAHVSTITAVSQPAPNATISPVSNPAAPSSAAWTRTALSLAQAIVTRTPVGFAVRTAAAIAWDGYQSRTAALAQHEAVVQAGIGLDVSTASGKLAAQNFLDGIRDGTLRGVVAGQAAAILEMKEPGITERAAVGDAAAQAKQAEFIRGAVALAQASNPFDPDATSWKGWIESHPPLSEEDRKLIERVEGFTAEAQKRPEILDDPVSIIESPIHTGNTPVDVPVENIVSTPIDAVQGPDIVTSKPGLPNNGIDYKSHSTAKPGQATAPRNVTEQALWNEVVSNPAAGRTLDLTGDKNFKREDGFVKKQASLTTNDGKTTTIHYQYNSNTGEAYDIKIVSPEKPH